jgi:hypothetical protein
MRRINRSMEADDGDQQIAHEIPHAAPLVYSAASTVRYKPMRRRAL